ncbi:MAG: cob(I)yrinic acid a,c-diamide adenosyltransferase [Candidatus Thermoplasmatota archaeon]|nr:cob(I)yrinic acid a,c-diamide adenosyltransferase [Candidatus Thermoplasmatota archaeon]
MNTAGLVYVYTGDGQGKTTAALGLAARAAGTGRPIAVIQFLKKGDYGETSLSFLNVEQYGSPDFVKEPTDRDQKLARQGLQAAERALARQPFLLVLDEVNVAVSLGLLTPEAVLRLVEKRGATHIVLTGRDAPASFIEKADVATRMEKIKHRYDEGGEARRGLEY